MLLWSTKNVFFSRFSPTSLICSSQNSLSFLQLPSVPELGSWTLFLDKSLKTFKLGLLKFLSGILGRILGGLGADLRELRFWGDRTLGKLSRFVFGFGLGKKFWGYLERRGLGGGGFVCLGGLTFRSGSGWFSFWGGLGLN